MHTATTEANSGFLPPGQTKENPVCVTTYHHGQVTQLLAKTQHADATACEHKVSQPSAKLALYDLLTNAYTFAKPFGMDSTESSIVQRLELSPHCTTRVPVLVTSWPDDPLAQYVVLHISRDVLVEMAAKDEASVELIRNAQFTNPGVFYLKDFMKAEQHMSKYKTLHFVIPTTTGYIVRSDFVRERMRGCQGIDDIEEFVIPGQYLSGTAANSESTLWSLLQSSAGVIVTGDNVICDESRNRLTHMLNWELHNRLSWPWLLPRPLGMKRVAIIGEKRTPQECERFYTSAAACGVSLVVFERSGHWMEDENGQGRGRRERFECFEDFGLDNFRSSLVAHVRALPYKIDGMFSAMDTRIVGVAEAAIELGLPSAPLTALQTVTNKYETRKLQATPTMLEVCSLRELETHLSDIERQLRYPVIVKPTRSSGSFGVSKVQSSAELIVAVKHALEITALRNTKQFGLNESETTVIIESYCTGPEVDANFVIWDNELLFFEVVDNFPCAGDNVSHASETEGFIETGSLWPSGIPQVEVDILQNELLDMIRGLGFSQGVFHVEARVRNSSVEWQRDHRGTFQLAARKDRVALEASTFLLEINPRAPGQSDSAGSAWANGIDYYALALMSVIGNQHGFRSLAHSFRHGPQFHCATGPLHIRGSGILLSGIDLGVIAQQDEDVAESALELYTYFQKGEAIPPASEKRLPWLGFIMLESREGRKLLLERLARATRNLHFPVRALV